MTGACRTLASLGDLLIQSAKEARAIARGEAVPARVHIPREVDVKAIRRSTGLSQVAFAQSFGIPIGTLRDWEQGRSRPEGVARAYLLVVREMLMQVREALRAA